MRPDARPPDNDMVRKVRDSYAAFRKRTGLWSRVSIKAALEAREGQGAVAATSCRTVDSR